MPTAKIPTQIEEHLFFKNNLESQLPALPPLDSLKLGFV